VTEPDTCQVAVIWIPLGSSPRVSRIRCKSRVQLCVIMGGPLRNYRDSATPWIRTEPAKVNLRVGVPDGTLASDNHSRTQIVRPR